MKDKNIAAILAFPLFGGWGAWQNNGLPVEDVGQSTECRGHGGMAHSELPYLDTQRLAISV